MTPEKLFFALLAADTTAEVEKALDSAGYLSDMSAWRVLGDLEDNGGIVDAQADDAISALSEKITNSVDAVLIDRCRSAGIDPTDPEKSPASYQKAIAQFFPTANPGFSEQEADSALPWPLPPTKAGQELISMAVSGDKGSPSISVADQGEGQTPGNFPKTFLSLLGSRNSQGNQSAYKSKIPFTQGQFNMGGAAVYQFAGYQLLVSKRNPLYADQSGDPRSDEWGFTVIRRYETDEVKNGVVVSYLAPLKSDEYGEGQQVLSFQAQTLDLMPSTDGPKKAVPHKRSIPYGTLVKLYEYELAGAALPSHALMNFNSILYQIDTVLPMTGLPIYVYETRYNKSGAAIKDQRLQVTPMNGLLRRVDRMQSAKPDNQISIQGTPVTGAITIDKIKFPWVSYVANPSSRPEAATNRGFKELTGKGMRQVVLHKNGQRLGNYSRVLHRSAGLGLLANDNTIVTFVDMSNMTPTMQRKMFSTNRTTMKSTDFRREFERRLIQSLKDSAELSAYQDEQRSNKALATSIDEESLKTFSESFISDNPELSDILNLGSALVKLRKSPGGGGTPKPGAKFVGKDLPTYLHHQKSKSDHIIRDYALGTQMRFQLLTDVKDDFLSRTVEAGNFKVVDLEGNEWDYSHSGIHEGIFNVVIEVPEKFKVKDTFHLSLSFTHSSLINPVECTADVKVVDTPKAGTGGSGKRTTTTEEGGPLGGSEILEKGGLPGLIRRYDGSLEHFSPPTEQGFEPWDEDWTDESLASLEDLGQKDGADILAINVNIHNRWLVALQNRPSKRQMIHPQVLEKLFVEAVYILALGVFIEIEEEAKGLESGQRMEMIDNKVKELKYYAPTLLPSLLTSGRTLSSSAEIED